MPANKIGSYIVQYRSRKREEAEQERQRRIEDAKRAPKIIDPSFELFGFTSPQEHLYEETPANKAAAPSTTSTTDDWVFQRRASTMPTPYQFEPYCEVTPKSSTSSSASACSSVAKPVTDYDMGWDTTSTARPRPQSYLPSSASANYSMSMSDLHKDSTNRSRRQTTFQESSLTVNNGHAAQSGYRVGASLTRPFSINDPLEFLSEPVSESHLYNQTSSPPYDAISRDGRSRPTSNQPNYGDYRR